MRPNCVQEKNFWRVLLRWRYLVGYKFDLVLLTQTWPSAERKQPPLLLENVLVEQMVVVTPLNSFNSAALVLSICLKLRTKGSKIAFYQLCGQNKLSSELPSLTSPLLNIRLFKNLFFWHLFILCYYFTLFMWVKRVKKRNTKT